MSVQQEEDQKWFWNQLEQYLSKAGLKQSKQRNLVIDAFLEMNDHVSAEELFTYVKDKDVAAGMATIYRTLNLLKDAGLVEQKQFQEGKAVFEVSRPNEHHDHLICLTCDRVIEFENTQIERLQQQIADSHGIKLTHHSLDLFGTCMQENCKHKKNINSPSA